MKIVHVVPFVGAESAGTAYCIPRLCNALAEAGGQIELHALAPLGPLPDCFASFGYPRHRLPHPRLGRSPEMAAGLRRHCQDAQIIHNNSLWMFPNIYPEFVRRGTSAKSVISPHGTLSEWALRRSRWKKEVMLWLGQERALRQADMFHATGAKEYEEIRRYGLRQPVVSLPNGIDLTALQNPVLRGKRRRLLFLGRLHVVKGIEYLIRVWSRVQRNFTDWELMIVGPGEAKYVQSLHELARTCGCERLIFHGEVNGAAKFDLYRSADLYILPSHTENFGMSVAEALSCEVPVLTTVGTPWKELPARGCGWCVGIGEDALEEAFREALAVSPEALAAAGKRGRQWMASDFSWPDIGQKMLAAYEWLLDGGEKPPYIYLD